MIKPKNEKNNTRNENKRRQKQQSDRKNNDKFLKNRKNALSFFKPAPKKSKE